MTESEDRARELGVLSKTVEILSDNITELKQEVRAGFATLDCKPNTTKINEMYASHTTRETQQTAAAQTIIKSLLDRAVTVALAALAAVFGVKFT
jgi:zona occludens toxin (predicted ATPase)